MKIQRIIDKIISCSSGIMFGKEVFPETTRDKVLFGNPELECTGIVTTVYASYDVIKKAVEMGYNFIIVHEALFWNHGDHTDWLADNIAFQRKKLLLEENDICIWRCHDYIHAGFPLIDGKYTDGIFYGLMKEMGWDNHLIGNVEDPMLYHFPEMSVQTLGNDIIHKLSLSGMKIIGSSKSPVNKMWICGHITGRNDREIIRKMDEENIDTVLALECIDYTVAEYAKDATMSGIPKTIIVLGHFNAEEPGMKYMTNYLPDLVGLDCQCLFIPSTDMYEFLPR